MKMRCLFSQHRRLTLWSTALLGWAPALACSSQPQEPAAPPAKASSELSSPEACCDVPKDAEHATSPAVPDPMTWLPAASTSIGSPVEGRLEGGVPLPLEAPGLRFNPAKNPDARHGTVELVQALLRAAALVDQDLPGNVLTVGDLSMPEGGPIPGHASHRSGRDVDVLFFLLDAQGHPVAAKAIPIEPDGSGVDYGDLSTAADDVPVHLDVPRTWKFLEALVSDEQARINRIFVVEHVRAQLLEHARKIEAPAQAISRFGDLTCQPSFPHDDHMHIRLFCSAEDIALGCEDTPPIYPWQSQHLARSKTRAVLAGSRRTPRPPLTTNEGAEAKALAKYGEFAPEVTAFLERRKHWARKPHPGRRYCR